MRLFQRIQATIQCALFCLAPFLFDGHLIQNQHAPDRPVVGLLISRILFINKYLFN